MAAMSAAVPEPDANAVWLASLGMSCTMPTWPVAYIRNSAVANQGPQDKTLRSSKIGARSAYIHCTGIFWLAIKMQHPAPTIASKTLQFFSAQHLFLHLTQSLR